MESTNLDLAAVIYIEKNNIAGLPLAYLVYLLEVLPRKVVEERAIDNSNKKSFYENYVGTFFTEEELASYSSTEYRVVEWVNPLMGNRYFVFRKEMSVVPSENN